MREHPVVDMPQLIKKGWINGCWLVLSLVFWSWALWGVSKGSCRVCRWKGFNFNHCFLFLSTGKVAEGSRLMQDSSIIHFVLVFAAVRKTNYSASAQPDYHLPKCNSTINQRGKYIFNKIWVLISLNLLPVIAMYYTNTVMVFISLLKAFVAFGRQSINEHCSQLLLPRAG